MSEHKRKTKEEREKRWSDMNTYWGVSLMYWPVVYSSAELEALQTSLAPIRFSGGPKHTNLYLRIAAGYFDYNLLRAEIKRLLGTDEFVLLNRWRAMSNEYRSYVQVFSGEVPAVGTGHYGASAEAGAEVGESRTENQ